ncbi:FHA domain-containing protein, partial [bacterium]|nr:FHA domain-containing protein [bacterium]
DRNPAMHEEPRQLGGPSRFQRQSDDRGHFLILESREPVVLDAGKLFVIGRDPRSSLLVHSPEVSRQHCEIDWKGDPPRAMLCEVRSKLGTYLNGKLVRRDSPEPLRDGDEIRLGPIFAVIYRNVADRQLKEDLLNSARDATRENRLPVPASARSADPAPARLEPAAAQVAGVPDEGDLATTPVATLLGHLYNNRRTGVLTIFDGSGTGEVTLVDGRAKKVVFGALASKQALEHIARLTRGAYRFRPEEPPVAGEPAIPPQVAAMLEPEPPRPSIHLGAPPLSQQLPVSAPLPIGNPFSPEPAAEGGGASFADMIAAMLSVQETRRVPRDDPSGGPPLRPATHRVDSPYPSPPEPRPASDPAGSSGPNRVLPLRGAQEPITTSDPLRPSTGKRTRETGSTPPPVASSNERGGTTGRSQRSEPARPTARGTSSHQDEIVRPGVHLTKPQPPAHSSGSRPRVPTKAEIPIPQPESDPAFRPETGQMRPPIEQSLPRGTSPWGAPQPERQSPAAGLVATARAAGLKGEALGIFAGEAALKLLDEGNLEAMVQLGEEAFALAESGTFEVALSTRLKLRSLLGARERLERCAELLDVALITSGPTVAAPLATRLLRVLKDDGPTPGDPSTPLGRIAAVAGAAPSTRPLY